MHVVKKVQKSTKKYKKVQKSTKKSRKKGEKCRKKGKKKIAMVTPAPPLDFSKKGRFSTGNGSNPPRQLDFRPENPGVSSSDHRDPQGYSTDNPKVNGLLMKESGRLVSPYALPPAPDSRLRRQRLGLASCCGGSRWAEGQGSKTPRPPYLKNIPFSKTGVGDTCPLPQIDLKNKGFLLRRQKWEALPLLRRQIWEALLRRQKWEALPLPLLRTQISGRRCFADK